jgi:predicted tellurium resistance membrane protein TerC
MELLTDPHIWATFCLLVGLELVLGIDNILLISILISRLPEHQRESARKLGLFLALGFRLLFLLGASAIQKLQTPLIWGLTGKELILVSGGLFLLYKAVKEMHYVVERYGLNEQVSGTVAGASARGVIAQIVLLDLVFSVDAVITAVGLTEHLLVIYASVLISFVAVLAFSKSIAEFVQTRPSLKILALAFLVSIGVTLFAEGLGAEIPKGYIYLPMGFALMIELLQMRFDAKRRAKRAEAPVSSL